MNASVLLSASHASRMPELLATKCREPSSSMMPPSIDAMDIHTSPSCRTSRVLTSKRTPKAADQPKPELVPEPFSKHDLFAKQQPAGKDDSKASQFPTKQAEPDIAAAQRRRSSGHIVVGAQRPQLILCPKSHSGIDLKTAPVDLKASIPKDPQAPV